jgi:organic hydroperoxide reductase OsmC/OhrA
VRFNFRLGIRVAFRVGVKEALIMTQVVTSHPVVRRKSFNFETDLQWLENRACRLDSKNKDSIRVTSPPEFQGEEGEWTPEDLFIGAINSCTMATFLSYASKKELDVFAYKSKAEGVLEFSDGHYRFTTVKLQPFILVDSTEAALMAEQLIHEAHNNCFISNSVTSKVILEPEIKILQQ